jgi:hypothetical protein
VPSIDDRVDLVPCPATAPPAASAASRAASRLRAIRRGHQLDRRPEREQLQREARERRDRCAPSWREIRFDEQLAQLDALGGEAFQRIEADCSSTVFTNTSSSSSSVSVGSSTQLRMKSSE